MPFASLPRLRSIVNMAVPPIIILVLTSVVLSDRLFGIGRLAGGAIPPRVRGALRMVYAAVNVVLVCVSATALTMQCRDSLTDRNADVTSDESCYPSVTLAAVALLVALFLDRVFLNLLNAPGASTGPTTRVIRGTTLVAVFMALSTPRDSNLFPLLLLASCNRASALLKPHAMLGVARTATRIACAFQGMVTLYQGSTEGADGGSRKTAVLAVVCASLSR
jgi:hypothetical protein